MDQEDMQWRPPHSCAGILDTYSVAVLAFPGPVYDFDLYHAAYVGIEMLHHPVYVETEVEDPCFFDKRTSEYLMEVHSVDVTASWQIANPSQLERRCDHFLRDSRW
jgi:hypothetical protein